MNLADRVDRLFREHAIRPRVCRECGGPVPGANMFVWCNKRGRPKWGNCAACGLAVDKGKRAFAAVPCSGTEHRTSKMYGADAPIDRV